jgi:hypothetical protein
LRLEGTGPQLRFVDVDVDVAAAMSLNRHSISRQGALITLSMTTPWLATDVAVYEPLKLPRSLWPQRSRTVAAPAGMPSALH